MADKWRLSALRCLYDMLRFRLNDRLYFSTADRPSQKFLKTAIAYSTTDLSIVDRKTQKALTSAIARQLLHDLDDTEISRITGLELEAIAKLRNS